MKINIVSSVVVILALSPFAQAVSPAPDGGYPGGNTAEGQNALFNLTTGLYNTALGFFSLQSNATGNFNTATGAGALFITTADENTAIGAGALFSNTDGESNAAEGAFALFNNTEGSNNTANGPEALFSNKTGQDNTATGAQALFLNDGDPTNNEGSENSAFGNGALFGNTTGYANSAFGSGALDLNNSGSFNTAAGFHAMGSNFALGDGAIATGDNNTALGAFALSSNIEGFQNTAVGDEALLNNTDGENNTAVGVAALANNTSGFDNTAIGNNALGNNSTGSGNTGVGDQSGFNVTTASNVICIGSGFGGENIDNGCFIGNIYSNIQPVNGTDPDYVTIASNGRLGRSNFNGSSRRFKHDILPMDKASELIFALKPVSFRYNKEYDPAERPSFGLIAEEVASVAPGLVGRNKNGDPESVRYEQINAMLLNEFLKEHTKVRQLEVAVAEQRDHFEATIAELKKEIKSVAARSKSRDEQIQEVAWAPDIDPGLDR
jgi:hypothetical protein